MHDLSAGQRRSTHDFAEATAAARPIAWRWLAASVVPLALVYFAMLNRYWVPSGDGEVYTCIARSLARGDGLKFNGFLAAIAPPGWPLVLSWAMRISPEFWFLKSLTTLSMLGAMALAFLLVRRFVTDRVSAGIILLTGTLSSLYPLTFWMHTEAFFCLLGFGMLLIAFRISEGVARRWEPIALLVLLAAGALTRWPGVLHVVLIAPILLSGPRQPWRRPITWVLVVATFLVGIGTFMGTRAFLTLTPREARLAMASGGTAETEGGDVGGDVTLLTTQPTTAETTQQVVDVTPTDDSATPELNTFNERPKNRGPVEEFVYRIAVAGKWFAWLLWQPTRFGQAVSFINTSALITGWLTIALLAVTMITRLRRREYLWIGLAIYTGGLCVMWPNPNARYFVPVAPFIILGVLLGIRALRGTSPDEPQSDQPRVSTAGLPYEPTRGPRPTASRLATVLTVIFVVATLLANVPLLAIDVWVFRSRDFYANYEAGANVDLIAAAAQIRANPPPPGLAIVVSERYENMGRQRFSKLGMRALHLLVDRQIIGAPRKNKFSARPTEEPVRKWLKNDAAGGKGAGYYVYQTGWSPWRVWHFRLSPNLQASLRKPKPTTTPATQPVRPTGGWELWIQATSKYRPMVLPDLAHDEAERERVYPTRVPGL